ncbi:DUF222 domain-containing protein [Promicromonospora sp. Populi]|uniref:HNH endonuclease n=1 Tax=Promicromonospora sp. Populi TaxID=3239420 RepID=UPI0034E29598
MILPGGTDTTSSVSRQVQAEWVDLLGELEAVKNAATATQARLAVALEVATKSDEAEQSIRAERRGRGVPSQVGLAMRCSPHAGTSFLGTARVWLTEMPHTFDALRTGVLSQWRATLLVRETSHLSTEHRARIDEEVCGPANLAVLARMGTRRLVARIKELAAQLDVHACVKRNARAVSQRRVSVRPAPDLMVYLTALVPMQQGIQAYAQLKAHADATKATGDERGTGQIMADTLIERVTGREPGHADEVPVTINLLVSDQALLAGEHQPHSNQPNRNQPGRNQPGGDQPGRNRSGEQPGVIVEGMPAGAGTVPAPVVRNLVAHAIDADAAWLRAIYVDPNGRLLATTSTSRFHPQGLAALLRAREQGICATSWCDAPVRHIDHVIPHTQGGATSLDNGQGLCARCNHAKQAPDWTQKATDVEGRQAVETVTPTGHTYTSVAPRPPEPVREPAAPVREPAAPVREPAAPVREPAEPPREPVQDPGRQPVPEWTPAVGMGEPGARASRSRYSIGCRTTPAHGAIAYRPRRDRGPGRRPSRRPRRADLAWA